MNYIDHSQVRKKLPWRYRSPSGSHKRIPVLLLALIGSSLAQAQPAADIDANEPTGIQPLSAHTLPEHSAAIDDSETELTAGSPFVVAKEIRSIPHATEYQNLTGIGRETTFPQLDSSNSQQKTTNLPFYLDPINRTAIHQAFTSGESLSDGIGGIPNPANSFLTGIGAPARGGIKIGAFTIRPTIGTGLIFRTSSGHESNGSAAYGLLSAGIGIDLGEPDSRRYFSLNYMGSLAIPPQNGGKTHLDQDLRLRATIRFSKLQIGLGISYTELSGYDRDVGSQVNRKILTTLLTSTYQLSQKTSMEWDLSFPLRIFTQGISSGGVTSTTFISYKYSPKTSFGIGTAFGFLEVENAATQTFEQLLVRMNYAATAKISINGTAGMEFRQAGSQMRQMPIFAIGVTWQIKQGTSLNFGAERRTVNSASEPDSNYTSTTGTISLIQRLGKSTTLIGTIGYENAAYHSLVNGESNDRADNNWLGQIGLKYDINRHLNTTLILSGNENFSTTNPNRFLQLSLQASYSF